MKYFFWLHIFWNRIPLNQPTATRSLIWITSQKPFNSIWICQKAILGIHRFYRCQVLDLGLLSLMTRRFSPCVVIVFWGTSYSPVGIPSSLLPLPNPLTTSPSAKCGSLEDMTNWRALPKIDPGVVILIEKWHWYFVNVELDAFFFLKPSNIWSTHNDFMINAMEDLVGLSF